MLSAVENARRPTYRFLSLIRNVAKCGRQDSLCDLHRRLRTVSICSLCDRPESERRSIQVGDESVSRFCLFSFVWCILRAFVWLRAPPLICPASGWLVGWFVALFGFFMHCAAHATRLTTRSQLLTRLRAVACTSLLCSQKTPKMSRASFTRLLRKPNRFALHTCC